MPLAPLIALFTALPSTVLLTPRPAPDGPCIFQVVTEREHDLSTSPSGESALAAARAAGLSTAAFGGVTAVGPRDMVTLLMPPAVPDLADGLERESVLKLLVADLSEDQWKLLTKSTGLGSGDLSSTYQKQLFVRFIAPDGSLSVSESQPKPNSGPNLPKDLTASLDSVRLRLGQSVRVYIQANGRWTSAVLPGKYQASLPDWSRKKTLFGATAKENRENSLRRSELLYDRTELASVVAIPSKCTVAEVVKTVSNATHIAIFVDPRYGRFPCTFKSSTPEIRASDMLRTLAFSVSGTYRKVGSAFVLTSDIVGNGKVRESWRRFAARSELEVRQRLAGLEVMLASAHDYEQLPDAPSDERMTPAQKEQAKKSTSAFGIQELTTTFGSLTEGQRALAIASAKRLRLPIPGAADPAEIVTSPVVELLAPSLDAPVFVPGAGAFMEEIVRHKRGRDSLPVAVPTSKIEPSAELKQFGARCLAVSLSQLEAEPEMFKTAFSLGFGEVWISVPYTFTAQAAPLVNRLEKAVGQATKVGLHSRLVFSAFTMSKDAALPSDLDITEHAIERGGDRQGVYVAQISSLGSAAAKFCNIVASVKHVDGLVLEDLMPPGYGLISDSSYSPLTPTLGYTSNARSAFLEKYSVDPVDIDPHGNIAPPLDVSVPIFDDPTHLVDNKNRADWQKFRRNMNALRVQEILDQLLKTNFRSSLLIRQVQAPLGGDWFGTWLKAEDPIPGSNAGAESTSDRGLWARKTSEVVVAELQVGRGLTPSGFANAMATIRRQLKPDSIAVDLRYSQAEPGSLSQLLKGLLH